MKCIIPKCRRKPKLVKSGISYDIYKCGCGTTFEIPKKINNNNNNE